MGKAYAVAKSRYNVGFSDYQPDKNSPSSSLNPSKPRVLRSRRVSTWVETEIPDAIPNSDHLLNDLSVLDRQRSRIQMIAEILADAATRRASKQIPNKKEASR